MNPVKEVVLVVIWVLLIILFARPEDVTGVDASWGLAIYPIYLVLEHWLKNPHDFKNLWRPAGKQADYILMYFSVFIFWRLITLTGELNNPEIIFRPHFFQRFAISLLFYLPNALWQQVLLNGYFLPKLEDGFQNKNKAALGCGLLFILVHIPNPVLMPVTLIGGMPSAHFFQKTKNIYALTFAHAVLAVSVMYFLPESWHHHLTVGPAYYNWKP